MSIVIGAKGMTEQPVRTGWTPERGFVTIRTWSGPKAAAAALESELRTGLYSYETSTNGASSVVTSQIGLDSDSTTETPINTWERSVNRFEKSIYEHPKFAAMTTAEQVKVKNAVKKFESGTTNPSAGLTGPAMVWFTKITKFGLEAFPVWQPVVRLTETVSAKYARSAAKAYVGSILTYNQMISLEGAPTAVLDNKTVPEGLNGVAFYGYLKCDPHIVQSTGGKWQIITEWEAGFYDDYVYTFV